MADRVAVSIRFNHLPRISAAMLPAARREVARAAHAIEAKAKVKTPPRVDTSAMMNGYQAKPVEGSDGMTWKIGNSQDYHIYNELGTVKMAAHPMLIPAAEEERKPFLDNMGKLVDL